MLPMSGISLTPINVISSGHECSKWLPSRIAPKKRVLSLVSPGVLSRGKQCPKSIQAVLIAMGRPMLNSSTRVDRISFGSSYSDLSSRRIILN